MKTEIKIKSIVDQCQSIRNKKQKNIHNADRVFNKVSLILVCAIFLGLPSAYAFIHSTHHRQCRNQTKKNSNLHNHGSRASSVPTNTATHRVFVTGENSTATSYDTPVHCSVILIIELLDEKYI